MRNPISTTCNNYFVRFKINGELWPFNGTAITQQYNSGPEYRTLTTGEQYRVVSNKPKVVNLTSNGQKIYRTTIKPPHITLSFSDINEEYMMKLKHLQDSNAAFEIRMVAFDSQMTFGTPLRPVVQKSTLYDPPVIESITRDFSVDSVLSANTFYSYRISAVTSVDGSGNTLSETEVSDSVMEKTLSADVANVLVVSWRHFSGALKYKVFGRTGNKEKYLGVVNAPATPGDLVSFTDDGSLPESSIDSSSPYTMYMGAGEYRWADDENSISIFKNGIELDPIIIGHNGYSIKAGTDCTVHTRYGLVVFNSPLISTDKIYMRYVWEPKVVIDNIEANLRPGPAIRRYSSLTPSYITDDKTKIDSTFKDVKPSTLYSPTITLYCLEF